MMKKITVLLGLLLIVSSCQKQILSSGQNVNKSTECVVFKNVNLITMTEETVLENTSVLVTNGKITSIGSIDKLNYPETAVVINAEGKYLLPGFSDMHIHYVEKKYFVGINNLLIANGVTLVRNMWGFPKVLKMRKKIITKKQLGPEIYTTGPLIDGLPPIWPGSYVLYDPKDVSGAITKMKKAGYDAIKVYGNLQPDVYNEIISVSKKLDIPVMGHIPSRVEVSDVLQSGQLTNEHFTGYSVDLGAKYRSISNISETDEMNLTVGSGIWNCPTLVVFKKNDSLSFLRKQDNSEFRYIPAITLDYWKKAKEIYAVSVKNYQSYLKRLYDHGANIVSGTDLGMPYVIPGFSLHEEFVLMQDAGLTPYQILLTTTVNPAKMLGYSDRLGTIEEGKDANLVLLEKNPLLDIKNTSTIAGVMVKGRWLTSNDLQQLLDDVEVASKK
jgi:Amidohydrolase family